MDLVTVLNINTERKAQLCDKLLIEWLGGTEIAAMLIDYHVERRELIDMATKYGVHKGNVIRRLSTAHVKLRSMGIMPPEWEPQTERAA